ncbi:MAG: hypothetical protein VXY77_00505 [Pseudomonadota bacterium]|nr:hypothetical protein [Pseudomonadota bacterium]
MTTLIIDELSFDCLLKCSPYEPHHLHHYQTLRTQNIEEHPTRSSPWIQRIQKVTQA